MKPAPRSLVLLLAAGLAVSAIGCGGDEIVLPSNSSAAKINAAGGDGQSALVGGQLDLPAGVLVLDAQNRPVEGQKVTFALPGGGQALPAFALTDDRGYAATRWTLGAAAGAQQLRAQVDGSDGLFVLLSATAIAGSGASFAITDGDDQSGPVGSALADSLVVRVTDSFGNAVSGVAIDWIVEGGGTVSPASTVTGSDGRSGVERVLGTSSGAQSAVATATLSGAVPVTFHHTAQAASPTQLIRISGDAQSAPAGFAVSDSLLVRLVDANGNGVGGKAVTWLIATGGGSVAPVNSTTSPQGYATTRWTLGPNAGANLLNAVFSGVPSIPFSATATADQPARLARISGDGQSGAVGSALPQPLVVKVTDTNGNPVANVAVNWTAVSGGTVSAPTTPTDDDGVAQVIRTLGSTPAQYATTAAVDRLDGSPVTFTATATAGSAVRLVVTQQPAATAQSGVVINPQPAVRLEDAFGNAAAQSGVAVTVTLVGDADLGGTATRNTSSAGTVAFSGLTVTGAVGSYRLAFSAVGLDDVQSNPIALAAGNAARLALIQQPGASAQSSVTLDPQPVVQVTDAAGNPVATSGRSVGASISDGDPAILVGAVKVTNAQGQAAFTGLTVSGTSGPRTILFSAAGLVSVESGTVTLSAGGAASLVKAAGDGQTAQVGIAVAVAPAVRLTDASGNPVAGVTVTFAVTAGGGTVTGTPATTNASGVATAGSWVLGSSAGASNNSLVASASGVSSVTFTASATAGPAAELRFVTDPANISVGQLIPTVQVGLFDVAGNPALAAGGTVTMTLGTNPSGGATLSGTTTVAVAAGVANFADLSVDVSDPGYVLTASAAGLADARSSTFNVTP